MVRFEMMLRPRQRSSGKEKYRAGSGQRKCDSGRKAKGGVGTLLRAAAATTGGTGSNATRNNTME